MQNNYSFICGSAYVAGSGEASFNGVFTRIIGPQKPAIHREFFVVTNLALTDNKKHKVKISIKKPLGQDLVTPTEFDASSDKAPPDNAAGFIWQLSNIKFDEVGLHKVLIEGDGKLIHSFYFDFQVQSLTK